MKRLVVKDRFTKEVFAQEDALEFPWLNACIKKGIFGDSAKEVPKFSEYRQHLYIEEFEKEIKPAWSEQIFNKDNDGNYILDNSGDRVPVLDGAGQPLVINHPAEKEMWVKLLPEYEVEIKDVTAEYEEKEAIKAERLAELTEIRGMIQNINNSNLEPWLKKMLRRLVRELKD